MHYLRTLSFNLAIGIAILEFYNVPMLKKFLILAIILYIPACNSTPSMQQSITIFAASSLTDVFTDLAAEFEAEHPDVSVTLNFAGSSQLAAQINAGAPANVFASANLHQIENVHAAGNLESEAIPFAYNRLTIITSMSTSRPITTIDDLGQPNLRIITAMEGVPIRTYTDQVLNNLSITYGPEFTAQIDQNIVSEESNVRQVVVKIALGEADAGFVYASDVTADIQEQVQMIEIPAEYNVQAVYVVGIIANQNTSGAQQFIDFILQADATLSRWGLEPVR